MRCPESIGSLLISEPHDDSTAEPDLAWHYSSVAGWRRKPLPLDLSEANAFMLAEYGTDAAFSFSTGEARNARKGDERHAFFITTPTRFFTVIIEDMPSYLKLFGELIAMTKAGQAVEQIDDALEAKERRANREGRRRLR